MNPKTRLRNLLSRRHKRLRAIAFRSGVIKWWWRYRHLLDGSYREVPPESSPIDPHRPWLWTLFPPPGSWVVSNAGAVTGRCGFPSPPGPTMRLMSCQGNPIGAICGVSC